MTNELLSYGKILKDIQSFRRAGTYNGGYFNLLDTPSNKYFKIFFYFGSKKMILLHQMQTLIKMMLIQ